MATIIPYEKDLITSNGGFIKPNGEIIYILSHPGFAHNYCYGDNYETLSMIKNGNSYYSRYPQYFYELKEDYGVERVEDIDVFSSTKLTKEQLSLFKLWLDKYEFGRSDILSDFLVYVLSFDKVKTSSGKSIVTTNDQPHIRFYNYYLMDWYIEHDAPMVFNSKKDEFEYDETYSIFKDYEDRKAEEEIEEIKSKVLVKDRHLFFK